MAKISVLLPVHNGMPYLRPAVESVLAQTFREFELLIVDDGSNDDTAAYCRSLTDCRVRYHHLERSGLVAALNFGLNKAQAPIIARMDADDISLPTRLEQQYKVICGSNIVLMSCQFDRIAADGSFIAHEDNLLTDAAIRWRLLFTPAFLHPGAMFLRSAVLRVGGYGNFVPAQDYDLWTKLAAVGAMTNHPSTLLQYRVLQSGVSCTNRESQLENCARISGAYAASIDETISVESWAAIRHFFATGQLTGSRSILDLAALFRRMRSLFVARYGRTPELSAEISRFDRRCAGGV